MDTETLADIGMCLYGELWQSQLARALGVSDRTVRRWAEGTGRPGLYQAEMIELLKQRKDEIETLLSYQTP